MSLEIKLSEFAQQVGTDIKIVLERVGTLPNLTTADKTSLVAAINEIRAAQANATGIDDDNASSSSTYSSNKIEQLLQQSIQAIVGAAPTALDTLAELAAALDNEENFAANLVVQLSEKVGVTAQSFTALQQAQARTNIGAASATDLTTLSQNIGNTEIDLLAIYTTAKEA